ncbi:MULTISPECIES: DUF2897 family protein [unclassified Shewanella]|uniref:DUF2897 family protein n=1 Tax=unclassified Shewanella TaxID=196818 RepID=UPI000C84294E|nr:MULTISPECIES: DUF2897 family protein [unclassified Shewanella]MDO6619277.1 DUF2897 family protein [Shewanella sp. 6_MG-2023]MDO6640803.1 DUF2897 family protein [Shewanella sp. 5_MG-2023]MDO6678937.1 DUF2897 family protein [Shewanella sp. 4_MG-2023]MDO6776116.1 DUF2897 family protein [Shewanella sp. 3_MG-2023]PMG28710.1 hypothetical protein BCU94_16045 [Shewanella sp. 10N.286.52.C2]
MNDLEVWLIIILVVGIIASNLAVLKYSAKFKMPQFGEPKTKTDKAAEDESVKDLNTDQAPTDKGDNDK